jgi:N-formylglutamate deformylase
MNEPLNVPGRIYPPGVVLHLPHDAIRIPADVREQFLLDDDHLLAELIRMTDHRTLDLFRGEDNSVPVVVAPVSRLVVDVERFELDALEPMAAAGMGVIYGRTSDGRALRRALLANERESLLSAYYRPHHRQLTDAVDGTLNVHGICLIIDGHSFPAVPLPYEADQEPCRPDICIGTDDVHTPVAVAQVFVEAFREAGFSVALNRPFAGAIVPGNHYRIDRRVLSVMVEINRGLYLDESRGKPNADYETIARRIRVVCGQASRQAIGMGSCCPQSDR